MRFRLATPEDIPDMCALYAQYAEMLGPYPKLSETPTVDFAAAVLLQMTQNSQGWFSINAIAGGEMGTDNVLRGGRVKGMLLTFIGHRVIGKPSVYAFCEMMVVDKKLRRKKIAQKLTLLACREATRRGAGVFECAWRPDSAVGKAWEATGMRPYAIYAAYVDPEGEPIEGLILIPSAAGATVASTEEP